MNKILFLSALLIFPKFLFSQKEIDVEFIFKMHLFLDNQYAEVKNNYSMNMFCENIKLNLDTLYRSFSSYSNEDIAVIDINELANISQDPIIEDVSYYKLNVLETSTISVNNQRDTLSNHSFGIYAGKQSYYILAINVKNGLAYRLSGFRGNDFIELLMDIELGYRKNGKFFSVKKFIKNTDIEGLNFKCLYKHLRRKRKIKKASCLEKVSEGVYIN